MVWKKGFTSKTRRGHVLAGYDDQRVLVALLRKLKIVLDEI